MNVIIWPQYCEYKEYGYKKRQDGSCILTLPVGDKIVGYVGTEQAIHETIDMLVFAEMSGMSPEDSGLSTELANKKLGELDS